MRSRPRGSEVRFLTVKELARSAGVADHVVRFYARNGLIRATQRTGNGYRQFVPFDVKRIRFVRAAQSLGFTLAEVDELMRHSRLGKAPCPLARDIIDRRLAENLARLADIRALQDRMQRASDLWREMPDQVPRGETLCALIEAVAGEPPRPPKGEADEP